MDLLFDAVDSPITHSSQSFDPSVLTFPILCLKKSHLISNFNSSNIHWGINQLSQCGCEARNRKGTESLNCVTQVLFPAHTHTGLFRKENLAKLRAFNSGCPWAWAECKLGATTPFSSNVVRFSRNALNKVQLSGRGVHCTEVVMSCALHRFAVHYCGVEQFKVYCTLWGGGANLTGQAFNVMIIGSGCVHGLAWWWCWWWWSWWWCWWYW